MNVFMASETVTETQGNEQEFSDVYVTQLSETLAQVFAGKTELCPISSEFFSYIERKALYPSLPSQAQVLSRENVLGVVQSQLSYNAAVSGLYARFRDVGDEDGYLPNGMGYDMGGAFPDRTETIDSMSCLAAAIYTVYPLANLVVTSTEHFRNSYRDRVTGVSMNDILDHVQDYFFQSESLVDIRQAKMKGVVSSWVPHTSRGPASVTGVMKAVVQGRSERRDLRIAFAIEGELSEFIKPSKDAEGNVRFLQYSRDKIAGVAKNLASQHPSIERERYSGNTSGVPLRALRPFGSRDRLKYNLKLITVWEYDPNVVSAAFDETISPWSGMHEPRFLGEGEKPLRRAYSTFSTSMSHRLPTKDMLQVGLASFFDWIKKFSDLRKIIHDDVVHYELFVRIPVSYTLSRSIDSRGIYFGLTDDGVSIYNPQMRLSGDVERACLSHLERLVSSLCVLVPKVPLTVSAHFQAALPPALFAFQGAEAVCDCYPHPRLLIPLAKHKEGRDAFIAWFSAHCEGIPTQVGPLINFLLTRYLDFYVSQSIKKQMIAGIRVEGHSVELYDPTNYPTVYWKSGIDNGRTHVSVSVSFPRSTSIFRVEARPTSMGLQTKFDSFQHYGVEESFVSGSSHLELRYAFCTQVLDLVGSISFTDV